MDFFRLLPLIGKQKVPFLWESSAALPFNITLSVTFRCLSRCMTCNVTSRKAQELTPDEYRRIFRSLGKNAHWITISGGEPFLRGDLPEIIDAMMEESSPGIINIPTSGTMQKQITRLLPQILDKTRGSQLTLNFSLDEVGERHDRIRRTPGNWEKTLASLRFAKSLKADFPHLTIGIHTVISVYNVDRLPVIYEELQRLAPDSYITEIAEERAELLTIGAGITPSFEQYAHAVDFIVDRIRASAYGGFASIIKQFRLEYYHLVKKTLIQRRQVIPCYAGSASCHIAADGSVWGCCVRAESLGNVREAGYDIGTIWNNGAASEFRRSVKEKRCYCPLANASYTNMIMDPFTVSRIAWNLAFLSNNRSTDITSRRSRRKSAQ